MGFLDRLFGSGDDSGDAGRDRRPDVPRAPRPAASDLRDPAGRYAPPPAAAPAAQGAGDAASGSADDRQAVERYRYLLRTAPPETVEQVHAEAFGRLTPAQRQQVLQELSSGLDPAERPRSDEPEALARAATRAEYRQPGFMERTFGGRSFSNGPGFGSMLGASMLGTIGGYVVGSALVGALFDPGYDAGYADGVAADDAAAGGSADGADGAASDPGTGDGGGADAAADVGGGFDGGGFDGGGYDGGGFGGGDFGGGDFGGGDFGF